MGGRLTFYGLPPVGRTSIALTPFFPSPEEGELRVIALGPTFASLVAGSFDQIRGSAEGNVAVLFRMLDALHTVASLTTSVRRRQVLRDQVEWIAEVAARTIKSPPDRTRFENRLAQVGKAFETVRRSTPEPPTNR